MLLLLLMFELLSASQQPGTEDILPALSSSGEMADIKVSNSLNQRALVADAVAACDSLLQISLSL